MVSRTLRLLWILFWLVSVGGGMGGATAAPLEAYATGLATADQQRQALEQMRELADPSHKEILIALKEGALYVWQDKLLILGDSGVFKDLAGQALLDAAGQPFLPDDAVPVPLEESNIPLVQRVLDVMSLTDPDPRARKAAALKLGNLRDAANVGLLEKALTRESDPSVRPVMVEALHKLRLFDPDPQVRRQSVEHFAATRAESALSLLKSLVAHEQDVGVNQAMQQAITSIDGYLRLRNLVGFVFNGLSLASILLMMSLGLAITFGLMGVINMAHGELLMLGSYTAYVVQEFFATYAPAHLDYFFFVALPLSLLLVGAVGLCLERGLLRFLYGRPLESLLVTWGIGLILQQGVRLSLGDQTSVNPPTWFRGGWEVIPGLVLPYSRVFIVVLSMLSVVAVYWLLYRSTAGLKIRAVMQNRDIACCMGIAARRIDAFTFAMGAALAGLAGCALSLIGTVDPEVGKTYIVDSFMVVVLGGVGKIIGTVLAALGLGMSNKLLEPAIGGTAAAVYAKVGILLLVIIFLQIRPTGLFPPKERATEAITR
ncbi:MAG TPA: urea ABC transporter permease subunit UrtB [Candidatus Tectomicrobia bacterium]